MTNISLAQKMASLQGRLFEQNCQMSLECAGFKIDDEQVLLKDIGVEVDLIATNQNNISFFVTCKGSMRGARPGSRRTDTLKKALCDAFLMSQAGWSPVILMTSHVAESGSGRAMLEAMNREVLYDVLDPWNHGARLCWLANASEAELLEDMRVPLAQLYAQHWFSKPTRALPVESSLVRQLDLGGFVKPSSRLSQVSGA